MRKRGRATRLFPVFLISLMVFVPTLSAAEARSGGSGKLQRQVGEWMDEVTRHIEGMRKAVNDWANKKPEKYASASSYNQGPDETDRRSVLQKKMDEMGEETRKEFNRVSREIKGNRRT